LRKSKKIPIQKFPLFKASPMKLKTLSRLCSVDILLLK
jgi:hypothetical protein